MANRAHSAASALMVSATLLTAGVAAGQDVAHGRTIVLRVHDYACLDPDDLAAAQARAAAIFESAGIRLLWVRTGERHPAGTVYRPLTIVLLSKQMGEKKIAADGVRDGVLGQALNATGRAYVFTHRVARVSANYARPVGHVLGTVLAHEIGHLVLPHGGHAKSGIMGENVDAHLRSDDEARLTMEEAITMAAIVSPVAPLSGDRDMDLAAEQHRAIVVDDGPSQ